MSEQARDILELREREKREMGAEVARGANREKQARHFGLPRSKAKPDECQAVLARRFAESAKSETYVTLGPDEHGANQDLRHFFRPGHWACGQSANPPELPGRLAGSATAMLGCGSGCADGSWLSLSPWLRCFGRGFGSRRFRRKLRRALRS